ncbi:pepsin A-like [Platysternon megacephalum]|uniref:Pepsin A-like n=1 Tax=Platysternon megacephalum TaxID=55544 RepID=A0A4D9DL88_9SAUR|nr:pepsin A-like [Platysternon megacephalum]
MIGAKTLIQIPLIDSVNDKVALPLAPCFLMVPPIQQEANQCPPLHLLCSRRRDFESWEESANEGPHFHPQHARGRGGLPANEDSPFHPQRSKGQGDLPECSLFHLKGVGLGGERAQQLAEEGI